MPNEGTLEWLRDDLAKMEAELARCEGVFASGTDPGLHAGIVNLKEHIASRKKQIILRTS